MRSEKSGGSSMFLISTARPPSKCRDVRRPTSVRPTASACLPTTHHWRHLNPQTPPQLPQELVASHHRHHASGHAARGRLRARSVSPKSPHPGLQTGMVHCRCRCYNDLRVLAIWNRHQRAQVRHNDGMRVDWMRLTRSRTASLRVRRCGRESTSPHYCKPRKTEIK